MSFLTYSYLLILLSVTANAAVDNKISAQTVEEYIQRYSTIPSVFDRRDPFIKSEKLFNTSNSNIPSEFANMPITDLQRFNLREYKLIAVMLGDEYSRALVMTPEKKVLIVREKDRLSKRFNLVKKITENSIVLVERSKGPRGKVMEQEESIMITPPSPTAGK